MYVDLECKNQESDAKCDKVYRFYGRFAAFARGII
jgi:hypothetical protein